MAYECPPGWRRGTLPMSEDSKNAHREAALAIKDHPARHINRGYETLLDFSNRIDNEGFKSDFIVYKFSDSALAEKYNCTIRMVEKYRRANNLFKSL